MSGVEELAVRVAIEKEKADKAKLAELLQHVWKKYLANGRKANDEIENFPERRYYRGLATAYLDVYSRAEELYGYAAAKKLLERP